MVTAKRLAVVALAVAAVWLVVRTAALGVLAVALPGTALAIAPGNPVALIAASGYGQGRTLVPTAAQTVMLSRAARADPLYPEPYLAAAAATSAGGDKPRAIRLAEIARSRDPRDRVVHLFLLEHYARAGQLDRAVAEMNPLVALAGATAPALVNALSALAQTEGGRTVIARALRANPSWRSAFIRQGDAQSEGLAFRTLLSPSAKVAEPDRRSDQAAFLDRLVQQGDYQRAYLAWVNFLPRSHEQVDAIYDGDFAGRPGLPPFNWTLVSNEAASAERRSDSSLPGRTALDVNFFGTGASEIATQTLFVQPGSYTFAAVAAADGGGPYAGTLTWQLTCLPRGVSVTLATIDRFDGQPRKFAHPVTIPAQGCEAQRLSLLGEPGDVSTLLHAQFSGLRLMPL